MGFSGGSVVKNLPANEEDTSSPANEEDTSSIPGSGRSPGEWNVYSLQYSCLGNPVNRGAWWATVHGITQESDMTLQLNNSKLCKTMTSTNKGQC